MESVLAGALASAIAAGAVIIIAGLGELLAERTGVINLGIDGMMSIGALTGIIVVNDLIANEWAGMALAAITGMVIGGVFAVVVVWVRADQFLAGLGILFLGVGLSGQIGQTYVGQPARARFREIRIPGLSELPVLGEGLFAHSVPVYIAYLVLPLAVHYLLFRTRQGLTVRAVGQDPASADARGIRVSRVRFSYSCLNGALAGVAGAYLTLVISPSWAEGTVAGRGFIALALVIFANWKPLFLVSGAVVFGAASSLGFVVQVQGWNVNPSFLFMLPYLSTLVLIYVSSQVRRRRGSYAGIGPAALGTAFSRE